MSDANSDDPSQITPLMSMSVDNPEDDKQKLKPSEVVLPKALEDVLALKDQRAAQFEDDIFTVEEEKQPNQASSGVISTEYADADGDSDEDADIQMSEDATNKQKTQGKLNKNKRKKKRRKQSKKLRQGTQSNGEKVSAHDDDKHVENGEERDNDEDVTIEYRNSRIFLALPLIVLFILPGTFPNVLQLRTWRQCTGNSTASLKSSNWKINRNQRKLIRRVRLMSPIRNRKKQTRRPWTRTMMIRKR